MLFFLQFITFHFIYNNRLVDLAVGSYPYNLKMGGILAGTHFLFQKGKKEIFGKYIPMAMLTAVAA